MRVQVIHHKRYLVRRLSLRGQVSKMNIGNAIDHGWDPIMRRPLRTENENASYRATGE